MKKTSGQSIKTNPLRGHLGILTVPSSVVRARWEYPWVSQWVPRACWLLLGVFHGFSPLCLGIARRLASGPAVPRDLRSLGTAWPLASLLAIPWHRGENPWKIPWSNQLALGTHWLTLGHPSSGSDYTLGHSKDALVPSLGVSFYWLSLSFLHSFTHSYQTIIDFVELI